jgi:hypothetical protein
MRTRIKRESLSDRHQPQKYDESLGMWVDFGDAKDTHEEAQAAIENASRVVTVDISEVEPTAMKAEARTLQKGDKLFDVWGGTHAITKAVLFRRTIRVSRENGWSDTFELDQIVTRIPRSQP